MQDRERENIANRDPLKVAYMNCHEDRDQSQGLPTVPSHELDILQGIIHHMSHHYLPHKIQILRCIVVFVLQKMC